MKISRTDVFKKAANKQIVQLLIDHLHPSLNLEKLGGFKSIYSIRVNINFRMSIFIEKDEIILRRILNHDDLYKNP